MSKYRNIKIHVPTPEISEAVQKKLFDDGCFWIKESRCTYYTWYKYIHVSSEGLMCPSDCGEISPMTGEKEVPYQSILDPFHDVKIAWANGEVVQFRVNGKWYDWEGADRLVLDVHHEWRVKPRLKIYKQWERKFWDGKNVNMARSTDENPDWDVGLEWINEPELKEYEVPND